MEPEPDEPARAILLCIATSLFNAMATTSKYTLMKAACAFIIALVLTTTTAKILLQHPPKLHPPRRISITRDEVADSISDPYSAGMIAPGTKDIWRDERPGQRRVKKKRKGRKDDERMIRKLLMRMYVPKKKELLGGRREIVTEVLEA